MQFPVIDNLTNCIPAFIYARRWKQILLAKWWRRELCTERVIAIEILLLPRVVRYKYLLGKSLVLSPFILQVLENERRIEHL
jgi:hypothetical protein